MKPIRSDKMKKAARDRECTLRIVGVCNYDPATTILAHLPDESHGMSRKSDEISSCFSCSACHDAIDGRVQYSFTPGEKEWYMRRAMVRTWRALIELGVIKI